MQVILLDKVANLGNLGDIVKVKDGFARNFLIPTRRARRATETAIKEFEAKRADLESASSDKLTAARALGEQLAGKTVTITQKAGVDGRLFGSVTNHDVADALAKMGLTIHKSQIRLPNGPIKTVGEHPVSVAPHTDVVVAVTVSVVPESLSAQGSAKPSPPPRGSRNSGAALRFLETDSRNRAQELVEQRPAAMPAFAFGVRRLSLALPSKFAGTTQRCPPTLPDAAPIVLMGVQEAGGAPALPDACLRRPGAGPLGQEACSHVSHRLSHRVYACRLPRR